MLLCPALQPLLLVRQIGPTAREEVVDDREGDGLYLVPQAGGRPGAPPGLRGAGREEGGPPLDELDDGVAPPLHRVLDEGSGPLRSPPSRHGRRAYYTAGTAARRSGHRGDRARREDF